VSRWGSRDTAAHRDELDLSLDFVVVDHDELRANPVTLDATLPNPSMQSRSMQTKFGGLDGDTSKVR
jgi:hypothetical protein